MRSHRAADWGLAGTAWVMLGVAEAALRVVPFRRLMPILGMDPVPASSVAVPTQVARRGEHGPDRLHWAVDAAARRTPWTSKCLSQALVGSVLVRAHGADAQVWLGARPPSAHEGRPMTAHAWLVTDGTVITGAAGREDYGVVAVYATRGRRPA